MRDEVLKTGITPSQGAMVDSIARVASGQILVRTSTGVAGAGVLAVDMQELTGGEETTLHAHAHSIEVGDTAEPTGVPDGWIYFQRVAADEDSDSDSVGSSESSSAQVTAGAVNADDVGTSESSSIGATAGVTDGESVEAGESSAVATSAGAGSAESVTVGEEGDAELVEAEPVSNIIGYDGIAAFQAMTTEQRASIWNLKAYFNHKSVGGNIVGDTATSGVQHYGPDFYNNYSSTAAGATANTLCERIFDADNGQPLTKIAEWQTRVITHGIGAAMVASAPVGTHAVAFMKFCFTDKDSTNAANLGAMKTDYLAAVNAIKSAVPGLRIMHVGMPLGTAALWDLAVAHPLRIDLADWMKATFPGDIFFDLGDVERHHADGSTASAGGIPVCCNEWAADSSGHLNADGANWVAQAFLYAIYVAATRA